MSKIDDKYYKELGIFGCNTSPITDKQCSVDYYIKMGFLRTQSMFKYSGLPRTIRENILELNLQSKGFTVVTFVKDSEIKINKDKYKEGLYAFTLSVGLGGSPDYDYLPTQAIINNPSLGFNATREIGVDCVLIRSDPLLMGLYPTFNRYAWLLAENDITLRMYDINSRIPAIISANDDAVSESAKCYLKDIEAGKLGIITDNALVEGLRTSPYEGKTDKIKDLIEYHQYLRACQFNDIGLNANYNMKREALNSSESELNEDVLKPLKDIMLDCRKNDFKKVNEMYGTYITVQFNSAWVDDHTKETGGDNIETE